MLDFANTLAKPRAEGTWTSRKKGGKGGGCRNKDRRARFWKIDSATVGQLGLQQEASAVVLAWHRVVAEMGLPSCHCGCSACRGWFCHGWVVVSICQLVIQ